MEIPNRWIEESKIEITLEKGDKPSSEYKSQRWNYYKWDGNNFKHYILCIEKVSFSYVTSNLYVIMWITSLVKIEGGNLLVSSRLYTKNSQLFNKIFDE